jgi:hypothetical protein
VRQIRSYWTGRTRADRRFVVLAVGLPVAFFLVPALVGHPIVSGDNRFQNLPLRELSGFDLAHGHLPLWDPYIWSGTPLLAGFNAGSLFPATFLFAVLPAALAWSLTEALVFTVALVGIYVFLRLHSLSPLASTVGAVTFSLFGFMGAQLVHVASVQGWGCVVWMLVALHQIAFGKRSSRGMWAAGFGVALGFTILAGDPESITEGSMVAAIYTASLLMRTRDMSILAWVGAGAAGGLALGGAQWVPGYAFARDSQRGQASFWFTTAGSLGPANLPLQFVPFLVGGYGRFGTPYYFGTYSLEEISGYPGLIGLAALSSMAFLWRRDPKASDWRVFYLMAAVGLVLALGGNTPVSHLMFHVPLYRMLRLPSRNLAWVDLSAGVLSGFWVDRVMRERIMNAGRRELIVKAASLLPSLVVISTLVAILVEGPRILSVLAPASEAEVDAHVTALRAVVAFQCLLALGAAWLVLKAGGMNRRRAVAGLSALVIMDCGFYGLSQGWLSAPATSAVMGQTHKAARLAGYLRSVGGGRVAIFDPDRYDIASLDALDAPDVNVIARMPSVEGYGSIAPAAYASATGTHQQLTLSLPALSDGMFRRLGMSVLAVPSEYFVELVSRPKLTASAQGFVLAYPPPPPPQSAPPRVDASAELGPGQSAAWFWGKQPGVVVVRVDARLESTAGLRIGLVLPGGGTRWLPSGLVHSHPSGLVVRGSKAVPLAGSGLVLQATESARLTVSSVEFTNASGRTYRLAGALTGALRPGRWVDAGTIGPFSVYVDASAAHATSLVPPTSGKVVAWPPRPWGTQTYLVRTDRGAELVRSESFAPGWEATLRSSRGRSILEPVRRHGLVQSVRVPPGRWLVTFSYHPPLVDYGLLASLGGLIVLGALASVARERSRTSR